LTSPEPEMIDRMRGKNLSVKNLIRTRKMKVLRQKAEEVAMPLT
jgi:hypothetical protein